jgi:hypothetical protein
LDKYIFVLAALCGVRAQHKDAVPGSMLQKTISAGNFSDKFLPSNFCKISIQKPPIEIHDG